MSIKIKFISSLPLENSSECVLGIIKFIVREITTNKPTLPLNLTLFLFLFRWPRLSFYVSLISKCLSSWFSLCFYCKNELFLLQAQSVVVVVVQVAGRDLFTLHSTQLYQYLSKTTSKRQERRSYCASPWKKKCNVIIGLACMYVCIHRFRYLLRDIIICNRSVFFFICVVHFVIKPEIFRIKKI